MNEQLRSLLQQEAAAERARLEQFNRDREARWPAHREQLIGAIVSDFANAGREISRDDAAQLVDHWRALGSPLEQQLCVGEEEEALIRIVWRAKAHVAADDIGRFYRDQITPDDPKQARIDEAVRGLQEHYAQSVLARPAAAAEGSPRQWFPAVNFPRETRPSPPPSHDEDVFAPRPFAELAAMWDAAAASVPPMPPQSLPSLRPTPDASALPQRPSVDRRQIWRAVRRAFEKALTALRRMPRKARSSE